MDSQHRHELKTNELAEGLSHLPQLVKENSRFIIGLLIIATAFITWPMFNRMAQEKKITGENTVTQSILMLDQDVYNVLQAPEDKPEAKSEALDTLLINADELLKNAEKIDNPNLTAMAKIKAAQAIRTELHLRADVDAELLEQQIQKAKDAYQSAFDTAKIPTIKAMAQLGLGICSEELGQTEQAAGIYKEIVADESYKATALPKLAQNRLDNLAENSETFNFAAAPAPTNQNVPSEIQQLLNAPEAESSAVEPATENAAAQPQTQQQ